jgi:hypothetical protein
VILLLSSLIVGRKSYCKSQVCLHFVELDYDLLADDDDPFEVWEVTIPLCRTRRSGRTARDERRGIVALFAPRQRSGEVTMKMDRQTLITPKHSREAGWCCP